MKGTDAKQQLSFGRILYILFIAFSGDLTCSSTSNIVIKSGLKFILSPKLVSVISNILSGRLLGSISTFTNSTFLIFFKRVSTSPPEPIFKILNFIFCFFEISFSISCLMKLYKFF